MGMSIACTCVCFARARQPEAAVVFLEHIKQLSLPVLPNRSTCILFFCAIALTLSSSLSEEVGLPWFQNGTIDMRLPLPMYWRALGSPHSYL